jgi:hypothetical protein
MTIGVADGADGEGTELFIVESSKFNNSVRSKQVRLLS